MSCVRNHLSTCVKYNNQESRQKQGVLSAHVIPALSEREKEQYKKAMSYFFYSTGTPFMKASSPFFIQSQKLLRADAPTITRFDLSGHLLDKCYEDIQQQKVLAQRQSKHCSFSCDGTKNVKGEPIVGKKNNKKNFHFITLRIFSSVLQSSTALRLFRGGCFYKKHSSYSGMDRFRHLKDYDYEDP